MGKGRWIAPPRAGVRAEKCGDRGASAAYVGLVQQLGQKAVPPL